MNVAVLGGGAMGHVLAQMIEEKDGFALAGMVDPLKGESLADLDDVDVVIDFSNPANLPMVMAYCEENKCPAVIATTGFSDEETAKIQAVSYTHLVEDIGRQLVELGVKQIYTGHCTGRPALGILQQCFPKEVHSLHTGMQLNF